MSLVIGHLHQRGFLEKTGIRPHLGEEGKESGRQAGVTKRRLEDRDVGGFAIHSC